jgi:putative transposase
MARIDALYMEDPCSGSRRMVDYLARDGIPISRDQVRNLMRRMGLRAIYQKPRTTVPGDPSVRFPCLVDLTQLTSVDQVWATDITYIPLQKGFLYLVAIMDLHSRHVLSWRLSIGSVATTTSSLNGCGGQSSMRRSTYVPTAMAGRLRSAWLASYGGTAM